MDKAEIYAFLNTNPIFHLATIEEGKPHVRAMMLYKADENGIIFHTGRDKDLHGQLKENPNVELCFNDYKDNIQIRVSGLAQEVEDLELKKAIVSQREFLKPWVEKYGYETLTVCRVTNCIATIWTFESNQAPKTYIRL